MSQYYRFCEAQECRSLFAAQYLTQAEAIAMHAERSAALKRAGWLPAPKGTIDLQPYLGRQGQESCFLRGEQSRILRWEEDVTA